MAELTLVYGEELAKRLWPADWKVLAERLTEQVGTQRTEFIRQLQSLRGAWQGKFFS